MGIRGKKDEETDFDIVTKQTVKRQACVKKQCLRCEKEIIVPRQYFLCRICRTKNMDGNNGAIDE